MHYVRIATFFSRITHNSKTSVRNERVEWIPVMSVNYFRKRYTKGLRSNRRNSPYIFLGSCIDPTNESLFILCRYKYLIKWRPLVTNSDVEFINKHFTSNINTYQPFLIWCRVPSILYTTLLFISECVQSRYHRLCIRSSDCASLRYDPQKQEFCVVLEDFSRN